MTSYKEIEQETDKKPFIIPPIAGIETRFKKKANEDFGASFAKVRGRVYVVTVEKGKSVFTHHHRDHKKKHKNFQVNVPVGSGLINTDEYNHTHNNYDSENGTESSIANVMNNRTIMGDNATNNNSSSINNNNSHNDNNNNNNNNNNRNSNNNNSNVFRDSTSQETPARRLGLLFGDQILEVNGFKTSELTVEELELILNENSILHLKFFDCKSTTLTRNSSSGNDNNSNNSNNRNNDGNNINGNSNNTNDNIYSNTNYNATSSGESINSSNGSDNNENADMFSSEFGITYSNNQIVHVVPESLASLSDLRIGDQIIGVNGKNLAYYETEKVIEICNYYWKKAKKEKDFCLSFLPVYVVPVLLEKLEELQ
eukprot:Awhi_evm1s14693